MGALRTVRSLPTHDAMSHASCTMTDSSRFPDVFLSNRNTP